MTDYLKIRLPRLGAVVIAVAPLLHLTSSPPLVIGFLVLIYGALLARWVWQPGGNAQTRRRVLAHEA